MKKIKDDFLRFQTIIYLLFFFTACGQTQNNSEKSSITSKTDTTKKQIKNMSDDSPSFEMAHSKAKIFMNEDFFFSPIDETSPFGNDDGADTYSGFKDWRQSNKAQNPKVFLLEQIDNWDYPKFDIYETDIKKLSTYLKENKLSSRYMSGIDAAIIAIAFGQLYLEGVIDKDFNKLAKTALKRQLLPELLALWGDTYKIEREVKLLKMLAVLNSQM